MKGDFSRVTFDAANHFRRVLMQQGRVTLDADPNEQAAILLHYVQMLARDLIGPCGGPADHLGFQLTPLSSQEPPTLKIGVGRYYVDGILVENHDDDCTYDHQRDCPVKADDALLLALKNPTSSTAFWLYLDVWERHITPIEDARMREVALRGPDTCTRAKVVWQVKALPQAALASFKINATPGANDCTKPLGMLTTISSGEMAAELDPGTQIKDPCVVAPDARYRGAENQLYRVEIHCGNIDNDGKIDANATPTFKWSRDNGSVVSARLEGDDLMVASARGFSAGTWVELTDDRQDLLGEPGVLVKLSSVDGNRLIVDPHSVPPPPSPSIAWTTALQNPKVRRWDQTENDDIALSSGAIQISDATSPKWVDLEDGVRVQFAARTPGLKYRSGDYWLVPARVATGDIEWPRTGATNFLPPRGIEHHYAPIGWLTWSDPAIPNGGWTVIPCLCWLNNITTCARPVPAKPAPTTPDPTRPPT